MVIHETHVIVTTPIGTVECDLCWSCKCHTPDTVFEEPCKKTFAIE